MGRNAVSTKKKQSPNHLEMNILKRVDEDLRERIIGWIVLFREARARAYWIKLTHRKIDAIMRMARVGCFINRPVQTQLVQNYISYEDYRDFMERLEEPCMSFMRYCTANSPSAIRIRNFYNDER
mgnify:FL=1